MNYAHVLSINYNISLSCFISIHNEFHAALPEKTRWFRICTGLVYKFVERTGSNRAFYMYPRNVSLNQRLSPGAPNALPLFDPASTGSFSLSSCIHRCFTVLNVGHGFNRVNYSAFLVLGDIITRCFSVLTRFCNRYFYQGGHYI